MIVDPEKGLINEFYNPDLFAMGSGKNKKEYVGYKRALDLGERKSLKNMSNYEKEQSKQNYFKTRNMQIEEFEQSM